MLFRMTGYQSVPCRVLHEQFTLSLLAALRHQALDDPCHRTHGSLDSSEDRELRSELRRFLAHGILDLHDRDGNFLPVLVRHLAHSGAGIDDQVRAGDLSTRIRHNKNDEFSLIYESFNNMSARTQQLIEDIKEQHVLLQNAELAQLQAQIDPHFLYNSFNMIKYMAEGEEYEQISETVSNLAEYYRFINKETRQAIPLQAEVRHMETYLYIQQLRFEGRIQLDDGQLPQQAAGFMVPKLILQPLVENCYKHGLKNKLQDGLIQIRYLIEGDRLTLSIADNGGEMTEEKLEEARRHMYDTDNQSISHALSNTRRRLELAFGDPDMIALSINEDQGLTVALRFDLTKTAEG